MKFPTIIEILFKILLLYICFITQWAESHFLIDMVQLSLVTVNYLICINDKRLLLIFNGLLPLLALRRVMLLRVLYIDATLL